MSVSRLVLLLDPWYRDDTLLSLLTLAVGAGVRGAEAICCFYFCSHIASPLMTVSSSKVAEVAALQSCIIYELTSSLVFHSRSLEAFSISPNTVVNHS